MKRRDKVVPGSISTVDRNTAPVSGHDRAHWGLPLKNSNTSSASVDVSEDAEALRSVRKTLQQEIAPKAVPVRVFSYVGTPTNGIGNDGDFYVEELSNTLYGPKADGAWPEDGVAIEGPIACKRTLWSLSAGPVKGMPNRRAPIRPSGTFEFFRRVSGFLRDLLPFKGREIVFVQIER